MRNLIIVAVLMLLPSTVLAEEQVAKRPHWSLEVKGGTLYPAIGTWKDTYGQDRTSQVGGSLAYKIRKQIEAGIEGEYIWDSGQGIAPIHSQQAGTLVVSGRVKYELYPIQAFLLLRGVFKEDQWVVPYVGGGWSRLYYREEVEKQGVARGYADGYHARGGLQFLLDNLDPSASGSFYRDYGVFHTYLFIEAQYVRAMINTAATTGLTSERINLGGTSYFAGLLFEF